MHRSKLDYFNRAWYRVLLRRLVDAGLQRTHRILDYSCGNAATAIFWNF
jgi:hypothetical protein